MDISELEIAVSNILQDIYDSTDGVEYFNISLLINGFSKQISFCDIVLWSDDEDDRLYLDEENDPDLREDIEVCLRRRLNEEISKLKTIVV
jgi:hypothetical protein